MYCIGCVCVCVVDNELEGSVGLVAAAHWKRTRMDTRMERVGVAGNFIVLSLYICFNLSPRLLYFLVVARSLASVVELLC
jgi:hypothetical protein